jgi:hypothetical protein
VKKKWINTCGASRHFSGEIARKVPRLRRRYDAETTHIFTNTQNVNPKPLVFLSVCFGAIVGAAVVWLSLNDRGSSATQAGSRQLAKSTENNKRAQGLPSASVLQIKPNFTGAQASSTTAPAITRVSLPDSALRSAYKNASDYKAVLAMAEALPSDPEALRIKAEILEMCVKISDEFAFGSKEETERWEAVSKITIEKAKQKRIGQDKRKDFMESLPTQHRDYQARIAAYDRLNPVKKSTESFANPCDSLATTKMTRAEREAVWQAAENAGDPVAQVRSLQCSVRSDYAAMENEKDPNRIAVLMEENRERRVMSPDKQERFRTLLRAATNDTLPSLLDMLASSFPNGYFTLEGEAALSSQPRVSKRMTSSISCEMREGCERARTRQLDEACAYRGQCDAGNIDDYLRFYVLSPMQAQEFESQRAVLAKIIDTRDVSGIKFVPRRGANTDDENYEGNFDATFRCY